MSTAPSTITARHDKWLRDLIARTLASAAEREREAVSVTEAQPKTIKPIKPDQQRIATMKASAKRADQAVEAERARQQQRKAQQTLATVQKAIATV